MRNVFNKSQFIIDKSGNSIAIFSRKKNFIIDKNIIRKLIKFSVSNSNSNVRICMHKDKKDKIQNMIVLLNKKNKSRFLTHKHYFKDEIYQAIYGNLAIDIYKKNKIFNRITLDNNQNIITRLKKNEFHKVYPKSKIAIFHEIRLGPFSKNDSIFLK